MGGWAWLRRRLQVLFDKRGAEAELDDEVRYHLEREIQENLRAGMTREEARRRALVAFGGVERHKEEVRNVRGARVLDDLAQDARVALRSFAREPAFTVAVLLTLGIGIGGNVAMFGVVDAALLRALPYAEPDGLVFGRVTWRGEVGSTVSAPDYFDYREGISSLSGLAALTPFPVEATITGAGEPERVRSPFVSPNLFPTLGVDPVLGRHFLAEEGEPGGAGVIMLSHGYWQRRFGADPAVVGRALTVEGTPLTVVGVMPAGFRLLVDADAWVPMVRNGPWANARQFHNWVLVGRLAPGASLAAAQAEADAVSRALEEAYPDSNKDKGLNFTPLHQALVEDFRTTLLLLGTAVAALLLVACGNVAGLLLARGGARRGEMAVRSVMGAGRWRLARQMVTENVLLASAAALLGLVLAVWLERGILGFVPVDDLGPVRAGLSLRMVGAAVGVTALTVLLFGVVPALRVAGSDPAGDLRSGTRTTPGVAAARARSVLVVGQVALTATLLVTTGLLLRSFTRLRGVDPGFATEDLLTTRVQLPSAKYQDVAQRLQLFTELQRRLRATPGVDAVALASHLPVRDRGGNVRVAPPEAWGGDGVFGRLAYQRMVLPGYFDAMGIPLVGGRDFEATDDRPSAPVAILSASLAADLFPEGSALGRAVGVDVGGSEPMGFEVVGVVGDVAPSSLAQGSEYAMYFSYGQRSPSSMSMAVRGRGDAAALTPALREILRTLDPDVPVPEVSTMERVLGDSVAGRRAVMLVLGGFAAVALLLAAVGLYGVLAYQVSRRLHEIGVRMALGASVTSVAGAILRGGLGLVAVGLLLGLPASWFAGRLVQGMLFQVGRADPMTYMGVAGFLGAVASVACLLPARRAARVDPVVAFRAE